MGLGDLLDSRKRDIWSAGERRRAAHDSAIDADAHEILLALQRAARGEIETDVVSAEVAARAAARGTYREDLEARLTKLLLGVFESPLLVNEAMALFDDAIQAHHRRMSCNEASAGDVEPSDHGRTPPRPDPSILKELERLGFR